MDDRGDGVEISIDGRRFAGVFANGVRIDARADEITIDFLRLDPYEPRALVVARVTGTPGFTRRLIDRLEEVWHTWAEQSMPPEVRDDDVS